MDEMCQLDHQTTLTENGHARITKCRSCKMYNIIYHNLHLAFTSKEYHSFNAGLKKLGPRNFNHQHPEGARVLLKNTVSSVGLYFSREEVLELLDLYKEAELFEEVFSILY